MKDTQYVMINENGKYYYSDKAMTYFHRTDGPAIEWSDGNKEWYAYGKRHRLDGPAIENDKGREWFVDGKRHRYGAPAVEYCDGTKEWFVDGKRHRMDGPAIECVSGSQAWRINGESISEDEFYKRTDWREDQHIVDLRYLRDLLAIDIETASEHLKTELVRVARNIIDEMHDYAMEEKRKNGFLG